MAKVQLAFYKAKGNFVDKLIKWWTKSQYSHVELVMDGFWYSTSPRDLEVRKKIINPTEGSWDFIEIEANKEAIYEFYEYTQGSKYDWVGIMLSQFLPLNIDSPRRWFCSEWCAKAIGIEHSNYYSPERLYKLVRLTR